MMVFFIVISNVDNVISSQIFKHIVSEFVHLVFTMFVQY